MSTAIITELFPAGPSPRRAVPMAAAYGVDAQRRPTPRLRLTKRGRGVLTTLAAAPLVVAALMFALNGGMATATHEGSGVEFEYVTIASGQSLWQLAEDLAPLADPRDVIADIMQLNQLASADVMAGQTIAIPDRYLP
jgi:LysM domain